MTILPTRNEAWGFHGTIARLDAAPDTDLAWVLASKAIATATRASSQGVRDFLDSRYGRHFADDAANELSRGIGLVVAIGAATARWMGWRIDRRTSRDTGIPAGLPYLTDFATHFGVHAEDN